MKLASIILLSACLQVSASGLGQKITLSEKEAPLEIVFHSIEQQTNYVFFFDYQLLNAARKLDIRIKNASLHQVLELCFRNQPFTYSIVDRMIVVKAKEESPRSYTQQHQRAYRKVSGRVVNASGEPLAGASVVVKNQAGSGTQTDADGFFTIDVSGTAVITVSYVGFQPRDITVSASDEMLNITLQSLNEGIGEVVVVGYGTVRKSDLTGSVSQVKATELKALPTTNIMQALNGRAAGVRVVQNNGTPGSPVSVRIRGVNSILGGNEPLYVIDGFPYNGNPTFLQNSDIESIEILKDASSIAIYGSRGANGVVLITTRTAKKNQKTTVDFETGYSVQSVTQKMNLLNPRQYAELYNEQAKNDNLAPYFTQQQIDSFGTVTGTDWQDLVLQKAPMHVSSITVNSGSDRTRISLSAGIFQQEGIMRNSDFNRYSLRGSINHDISKIFSVSYSAILTRITRDLPQDGRGNRGSDVFSAMLMAPPTLSPYMPDGSYRRLTTAYPFISNALINPLIPVNEVSNNIKADRILTNAALTIKPVDGLSIRISGGLENSNDRTDTYQNIELSTNQPGTATISTNQLTSLLNENVVNYNKTFGDVHAFSATAGFTYQDLVQTNFGAGGVGFLSDVTGTGNIGSAATPGIPWSGYSRWTLLSMLGRLNYVYDDKYLATVSFRRDGSSRYSADNKWSIFPSAALAWRVSNEEFMKNIAVLSDLKLRTSYGATGSTAISVYQTLNQLSSSSIILGDALYTAFAPGTTLPGNLKWETTHQFDIGLDAGFLNNRIRFTADYYVKKTKNLLNNVQLPSSTGYNTTLQNVGEIENKGFEFAAEADVFNGGDFKWNLAANISFNKNKVLKLYNGQDIYGQSIYTGALNDIVNLLREGRPMGVFYGYVEKGYTANGNIEYEDLSGDGNISTADKTYIGDPNPDFIYGLNSTASYKGFELTLFIQGSQGNDIYNLNKAATLDLGMGLNQPVDVYLNHWTADKTDAAYPRISRSLNGNMSDRFVEDGSYLRFRNIRLAYNLPVQNWNMKWFRKAQLYVSGQNLITLTQYSWYDPEVNAYGSANSVSQGIDYAIYPTSKSVTVGIQCGF